MERLAGGVATHTGKVSLKYKYPLRRHKSLISKTACLLYFVLLFLGSSLTGYTVRKLWQNEFSVIWDLLKFTDKQVIFAFIPQFFIFCEKSYK